MMSRKAKLNDIDENGLNTDQRTGAKFKGGIWYNNGTINKTFRGCDDIPNEFTKGALKFKCPHCKKYMALAALNRYHMDNCKYKI